MHTQYNNRKYTYRRRTCAVYDISSSYIYNDDDDNNI